MSKLPSADILHSPLPSIGAMFGSALRWGVVAATLLVAVFAVPIVLSRANAEKDLPFAQFALWTLGWWILAVLVLTGTRLFVVSRIFADRAFTALGVVATFFGLTMLLIFFAQLGVEAYDWFTLTPRLVAKNNEFLKSRVDQIPETTAAALAAVDAEMEQAIAAADTEKKKEAIRDLYLNKIRPATTRELEATAQECRELFKIGYRDDTSPVGLLTFFLVNGPSREAQDAGIFPALVGSLLVSLITLVLAVPIGVGAALYLEEYRTNNLLGRLIQININNLAGVPSVVYGILGALVFVELIFKPLELRFDWISARNVLGGGMTLALLTLPVVIVASQEAIRAVPNSIRQGAYALGATQWQTIWRQVLPLAWPGIMTGTILSLSRAIGEAAPLVLFGALLFVNQTPTLFSRFTVLPMQIFGWADRPQQVFEGRTIDIWRANAAMGCIVLLIVLLGMNAIAIVLRNRSQRHAKW